VKKNTLPADALRLTPNKSYGYGWDVIGLQIPAAVSSFAGIDDKP